MYPTYRQTKKLDWTETSGCIYEHHTDVLKSVLSTEFIQKPRTT